MVMGIALGHGIGTGCTARDNLDIGLAGEQGIAFRLEGGIVGIAPAPDDQTMECHSVNVLSNRAAKRLPFRFPHIV